jgi:hypothetical protein
VTSFLMPVILFATALASVGLGVLFAYVAVIGILLAFGRTARPQAVQPVPARPRLMLVPTQNHASGD